jgi:hypothetical protein
MYSSSDMARISASDSSSTFLVFQLLASLGSFLIGAKGTETGAGAALGKKLDLAAVDATAGGKEGTVIWAKRAEGRVARTSCSGAGVVLAGFDSTGDGTDSTLVTLMFFAGGVWAGGAAVAALGAADVREGLALGAGLDAAADTAAVLAGTALAGAAGFEMGLVLATGLTAALAVETLALAAGSVVLGATADLPRGFVLLGVFTSCLLAVSKGRLLTVCPCAADPKPVHVLFKPLL